MLAPFSILHYYSVYFSVRQPRKCTDHTREDRRGGSCFRAGIAIQTKYGGRTLQSVSALQYVTFEQTFYVVPNYFNNMVILRLLYLNRTI